MITDKDVAHAAKKVWQKTPTPNLFKHTSSGNYYLRARLGKKNAHRESLRTDNYALARIRLGIRLEELNARRPPRAGDAPKTLWDALRMVKAQVDADPTLKEGSLSAYEDVIRSLDPSFAKGVPAPVSPLTKLTAAEVESWWKATAKHYSPARANYQLLFVQRALKLARELGALTRTGSGCRRRSRCSGWQRDGGSRTAGAAGCRSPRTPAGVCSAGA